MKEASKLFREIIPVIIGILIALFINNWNEDRKDKRYLTQIFSSIESEALSDIVESKENLMLRVGKQMDFIFQNFENSDMGKKIIVRLMMIDIINAEKALQDQIEEFIKRE